MAAQADVLGVIIGSIVGHAACTGAAVLGGKHLAEHIDERLVGVSGSARLGMHDCRWQLLALNAGTRQWHSVHARPLPSSHMTRVAAAAAAAQIVGGVIFLLFGAHSLYTGPE